MAPRFHAAAPLEDGHVAEFVRALHRRVTRDRQRQGRLSREHDVGGDPAAEPDLLEPLNAASKRRCSIALLALRATLARWACTWNADP